MGRLSLLHKNFNFQGRGRPSQKVDSKFGLSLGPKKIQAPIQDQAWGPDPSLPTSHSGGTETKVKEIVSDIPPHTNQNIGIF